MKLVSFRDNVAASHDNVLRSSAIFYVRESSHIRSTVSFMNYWKLKRGLEVAVFASTRAMDGTLLVRERLNFERGEVVNYRVPVMTPFEGSVEIEVFATHNLMIPYAAIVCSYETTFGYTMVHSYARTYSSHEIEEGRTLTNGREACWTLRDTNGQASFAVLHNGSRIQPAQVIRLFVRNHRNEAREVHFEWPPLKPFETRVIRPREYFDDLDVWLEGKLGQAKLFFELAAAFTRMLVGNERLDGQDMQVTHSNFDYSSHPTDMCDPHTRGYMYIPHCGKAELQVIVYPDMLAGDYQMQVPGTQLEFTGGETVYAPAPKGEAWIFSRKDGLLPTRIVTALQIQASEYRLPGECSLGIITPLQPRKRLWWGAVAAPGAVTSRLLIHDLPELYGGLPRHAQLHLNLHSSSKAEPLKTTISATEFARFTDGVYVEELWPHATEHLDHEAGYYSLYCDYGGLSAYTLLQNSHGSICLEHGF